MTAETQQADQAKDPTLFKADLKLTIEGEPDGYKVTLTGKMPDGKDWSSSCLKPSITNAITLCAENLAVNHLTPFIHK